jgi:hypothetical protein
MRSGFAFSNELSVVYVEERRQSLRLIDAGNIMCDLCGYMYHLFARSDGDAMEHESGFDLRDLRDRAQHQIHSDCPANDGRRHAVKHLGKYEFRPDGKVAC